MARFLRTVIHDDLSVAAGAAKITENLGVNPISFLLLTIKVQTAVANTLPTLANLLGVFTTLDVKFKGTSIVNLSPADLYRMSAALWSRWPVRENFDDNANGISFVTVPIPFSRKPYWPNEGFPATRAGDLKLDLVPAAAFTNILSPVTIQVEQVELLDATPRQFLKYTTFSKTPTAIAEHDVDLPLGNPIAGVLLFGTTVPTAASFNASIGKAKLLVDNVENYYSETNWESLHNDFIIRATPNPLWDSLRMLENLAAAYTQNVESGAIADLVMEHQQYAYLDFDPNRDDMYLLDTEGRGRVHLRITADVADDIRVLPIELIRLPGAESAAAA